MKQLMTIDEAAEVIGSRTKVYDFLGQGLLKAVKIGSRTKVLGSSLQEFIDGLPPAVIARPKDRSARTAN